MRRRNFVQASSTLLLPGLVVVSFLICPGRPAREAWAQTGSTHPATASNPLGGDAILEGEVTDPTGLPIPGADVEWGGIFDADEKLQRTRTDAQGRFQLRLRNYGVNYRLGVSAPGRAPQWVVPFPGWTFSVREVPRDRDAVPPRTVNFKLEPEHTISGIVIDEKKRPIQGVRVTAQTATQGFYSSFSSPSPPMRIPGAGPAATTDAGGRFRLAGLPAGQVQLNLKSPYRHVNDRNYPVDKECRITMTGSGRGGSLRVRVMDTQTDQPVTTFVVIRRYDPKPRTFNTPDGRFEWKDEVAEGGQYELHIYSRNYLPTVLRTRALALGGEDEAIAELSPGEPLLGRLADAATGKPMPGVPVLYGLAEKASYFEWPDRDTYVDGHHQLTGVQRAVSDERGEFWFSESAEEARGTLFILAPGYERLILAPSDRAPRAAGDPHVPVRMYPEATISGVLRKAHAMQADTSVSVWKQDPRTRPEETFEKHAVDGQGRFCIRGLGPGTYQVSYWTSPSNAVLAPKRFATVTLARGERKVLEPHTMEPD